LLSIFGFGAVHIRLLNFVFLLNITTTFHGQSYLGC
jgi:hypothetical protein